MPFRIVVVGSGIAGLGAAIALTNKGHAVTVLEATSEFRPIGGTIVLQANANRCLDHLGIYKSLLPFCNAIPYGPSTRRYDDGEFLARKSVDAHEKAYGYPQWPFHRADVHQTLVKAARERNVILRLGCPIVAVAEECHRLTVVVKGGEEIDADVIVGADDRILTDNGAGIESMVRKYIISDSDCVRDSGMDVTRAMIPADIVKSDPETCTLMDHIGLWCGPSGILAAMAVRRGDKLLLGLDCCHRRFNPQGQCRSRRQDIAQLREYFSDFAPAIQKVLSWVEEAHVWELKESMPTSWLSDSGRIILIGDAAHSSLPWVGQGAGMALEDAVSLAECLGRAKQPQDVPAVLQVFHSIRLPRCRRVQEWSRKKGQKALLEDGPEQRNRDESLKSTNAWVRTKPWNGDHIDEVPQLEDPDWKPWLCGHDAVAYVRRLCARS